MNALEKRDQEWIWHLANPDSEHDAYIGGYVRASRQNTYERGMREGWLPIAEKREQAAVDAAVAEEREACAEVADDHSDMESSYNAMSVARESMALAIAEAIRARASGETEGKAGQ